MSRRARTGAKLGALLTLGVGVFWLTTLRTVLVVLGLVVLAGVASRIRPRDLRPQLRVALPLVMAVFVAHGLLTGWSHAGLVGLRLVTVILAAAVVTATTRTSDILEVVEVVCRPLRVFGIDPSRVGLVLAMTIRLVPVLSEQLAEIRDAQRARGLERPGMSVLAPLLVRSLRLAGDLADALDARGLADARTPVGRNRRQR